MTDPADLSAAYVAAFNQRDWDALRTMLGESVSLRFPGFPELTDPHQVVGFYRQAAPALGDGQLAMRQIVSDGERWCAFMAEWNSDAVPDAAVFHE